MGLCIWVMPPVSLVLGPLFHCINWVWGGLGRFKRWFCSRKTLLFNEAKSPLDQQSLRFKGLVSEREEEYWKETGTEMTSDLEKSCCAQE
jgi:hypothetical protein